MKFIFKKSSCFALMLFPAVLFSHHFKGLPHYSYFENYPQVPVEEFLGKMGEYEMSLVVYDFQGMNRKDLGQPDNVKLYMMIFNLRDNRVYGGPATLQIRDGDTVIYSEIMEGPAEENVYKLQYKLPESGDYSLHVELNDGNNLKTTIPFVLSKQKIGWGKWISLTVILLVIVTAYGSRRARIMMDRKKIETQR